MRDEELDLYRGLIMMYIIGVIHNLYWGGAIHSPVKSFLLVEMPIIFFITGASNLFKQYTVTEFYGKRLVRILQPFVVFAVLCAAISIFAKHYLKYFDVNVPDWKIFLSWINPFGSFYTGIQFLSWHLWFMKTYLLVILLFPFLRKIFEIIKNEYRKAIPLLVIIALVGIIDRAPHFAGKSTVQTTMFYSFWTYTGFFYKKATIGWWKKAAVSLISFGIVILLVRSHLYGWNMQTNKFPPNLVFMFYTIGCFSLITFLAGPVTYIKKVTVLRNIVQQYSKYSLTMYLYQSFSFLLLDMSINRFASPIYGQVMNTVAMRFFFPLTVGLIYPVIFGIFETNSVFRRKIMPELSAAREEGQA